MKRSRQQRWRVDCDEERIVSRIDYIGLLVSGAGSMDLISIGLFWGIEEVTEIEVPC